MPSFTIVGYVCLTDFRAGVSFFKLYFLCSVTSFMASYIEKSENTLLEIVKSGDNCSWVFGP